MRGLLRWTALGALSGVLAGAASWVFLTALERATETRIDHPQLVWLLPVVGLAVGWSYHRFGGRAAEGSALLLAEVHEPTAWVPRRMAPMVAIGTVTSHLVGASVGREGTVLQMSGSLSDGLARALGLSHEDRRILLTAAIGGGFGAVFGVPLAGLVFGLEVQRPGRHGGAWVHRAVATLVASLVGNALVGALGHTHPDRPQVHVGVDAALLGRAALAGAAFGVAALAFVEATALVRLAARKLLPWAPARPAVAGLVVLAATAVFGRSYLGLSLPLADQALAGRHLGLEVPLLKLAFTAVCLGAGFVGGEVTPLFVIGATLGTALAPTLGLPPVLGAAIGFVAVFGAAANTPVACTVMAVELFGRGTIAPVAAACVVAALCSGRGGIYDTQRRLWSRDGGSVADTPTLAQRLATRSRRRDRPL